MKNPLCAPRDRLWCNKMNSPQQPSEREERDRNRKNNQGPFIFVLEQSAHSAWCVCDIRDGTRTRCYPLSFCRTWRKGEILCCVCYICGMYFYTLRGQFVCVLQELSSPPLSNARESKRWAQLHLIKCTSRASRLNLFILPSAACTRLPPIRKINTPIYPLCAV